MMTKIRAIVTNHQRLVLIIMFAVLSLFFVLPLAHTRVIYLGDDLPYHINRIQELADNLKQGNWYPYLYTYHFHGVPFLLGAFYPQVTLMPLALLSLITNNYVIGIYLGISFYTFLAMMIMYYVARRLDRTVFEAFITAVVFAFSACRTYDAYQRFALGEFLAMTFLVLAFYGLYALVKTNGKTGAIALGFGLSLVMLSHVLSTYLCVLLLIIELVVFIPSIRQWSKFIVGISKAICLFLASAAIYLMPFLEQELYHPYAQPSPRNLVLGAPTFSQLLENSLSNNLVNGYLLKTNQGMGIGLILILVIIWGAVRFKALPRLDKMLLVSGILLTMVSTQLFPWKLLQHTPIAVIQFPTRLLPFATIALALLSGKALNEFANGLSAKVKANFVLKLITLLALVLGPWLGAIETYHASMKNQTGFIAWATFYNGKHYEGDRAVADEWYWYIDQYIPKESQAYYKDVFNRVAIVDGKKTKLSKFTPISNGMIYQDVSLQSKENVLLPAPQYKNVYVYQNSKRLRVQNQNGLIKLPRTKQGNLILKYKPSLLDRASMLTSIVTWLLMALMGIKFILRGRKTAHV